VRRVPAHRDAVADLPAIVGAGPGGVLLQRDQALAWRELDDHLRRGAHVVALQDRPRLEVRRLSRAERARAQPLAAVLRHSGEQVGDADELGHERPAARTAAATGALLLDAGLDRIELNPVLVHEQGVTVVDAVAARSTA
jgi:hypothetical protein